MDRKRIYKKLNINWQAKRLYFYCLKFGFWNTIKHIPKRTYLFIWSRYLRNNLEEDINGLPKIISVDPNEIKYSEIPEHYIPTLGEEAVVGELGGHWDRFRTNFDNTMLHQSLKKRFHEGAEWEETRMYQIAAWGVQNGFSTWNNCSSIEEIRNRCKYIDSLYENIESNGYQSQIDLAGNTELIQDLPNNSTKNIRGEQFPDEVRVGIGRDGEIIRLGGGRHRISISKLLDVNTVPALVVIRHTEWQKLREELLESNSSLELSSRARSHLYHPDMRDITINYF